MTAAASAQAGGCGGLLQPKCPPPPPAQCANWVDDDRDGVTDLADPGCTAGSDTYEGDDLAPDINGVQAPGPDVDPRLNPRTFGFSSALSGWDGSGITPAQEAGLINAAGAEAQRTPVQWYLVEPTRGTFSVDALKTIDALYAEHTRRGATMLLTLGSAPLWASDYASCGWLDFSCKRTAANFQRGWPPRDIAAYAAFAARIAARYPLAAIETWNEPNISMSWVANSFPDPWRMAQMQCAAFDAVHKLSGPRTVTSPGMAVVNATNYAPQSPFLEYMQNMYGAMGRRCWDAFAAHVYPSSQVGGDGGSIALLFRLVRNIRKRNADTSPIWITETGSSTAGGEGLDHPHTQRTPEEQARMMRETINEMMTTPDIAAVFIHSVRDRPDSQYGSDPSDVQYGFGALYEGTGPFPPPKPVFCHLVGVVGNSYPGC
jgi:hypothetical protein